MNATQFLYPGSYFHCGSVVSLRYCALMIPFEASRPAGLSTESTDTETLTRNWTGFHPMSWAFLIAWTANFGAVWLRKTFAPLFLRFTICESTVGSVTSYDCSRT